MSIRNEVSGWIAEDVVCDAIDDLRDRLRSISRAQDGVPTFSAWEQMANENIRLKAQVQSEHDFHLSARSDRDQWEAKFDAAKSEIGKLNKTMRGLERANEEWSEWAIDELSADPMTPSEALRDGVDELLRSLCQAPIDDLAFRLRIEIQRSKDDLVEANRRLQREHDCRLSAEMALGAWTTWAPEYVGLPGLMNAEEQRAWIERNRAELVAESAAARQAATEIAAALKEERESAAKWLAIASAWRGWARKKLGNSTLCFGSDEDERARKEIDGKIASFSLETRLISVIREAACGGEPGHSADPISSPGFPLGEYDVDAT